MLAEIDIKYLKDGEIKEFSIDDKTEWVKTLLDELSGHPFTGTGNPNKNCELINQKSITFIIDFISLIVFLSALFL